MIEPQFENPVKTEFEIVTIPPQELSSINELNSQIKFLNSQFLNNKYEGYLH